MRWLIAALVGALVSGPASARVVMSSDLGFVTHDEVVVPAAPSEVWAELIAPAKWWDPVHTWSGNAAGLYIDAQATGCFCELLPQPADGSRRGSVEHLHVIQAAPGRLLRMVGGLGPLQAETASAVLSVSLTPEKAETRIAFEYRVGGLLTLKGGDLAGPVDKVLTAQLGRLAGRFAGVAAPAAAAVPVPPGRKAVPVVD